MTELRPAEREDLAMVLSWLPDRDACDAWSGGTVSWPADLRVAAARIDWDDAENLVLVRSGHVAGFAQRFRRDGGRVHLARIIVHPGIRGMGLGRDLLTRLIRSVPVVSLNVYRGNVSAITLYEHLGFTDAARPPNERGGADSRFMVRRGAQD